MEWYGNEDAGDLSMMGAADYSGHLGELEAEEAEKVLELYGPDCGWCGEVMEDPVFYAKGTRSEDGMCRKCAEDYDAIPADNYREFPTYG